MRHASTNSGMRGRDLKSVEQTVSISIFFMKGMEATHAVFAWLNERKALPRDDGSSIPYWGGNFGRTQKARR